MRGKIVVEPVMTGTQGSWASERLFVGQIPGHPLYFSSASLSWAESHERWLPPATLKDCVFSSTLFRGPEKVVGRARERVFP